MSSRTALPIATGILCLALLAGCGDDRLSREEFIVQADEICADINLQTEELDRPQSEEEFEEFVERGQEITEEGLDRLRALEPPEEDEPRIDRMLDLIEEAVGYLGEIQRAVADEDFEAMEQIGTRVRTAATEAQEIAEDYGFERCARTGIAPAPDQPEGESAD